MGYSIEELSSSEDFSVHKIVQCCCTSKCCTYKVVEKEDDCKKCQEITEKVKKSTECER